MFLTFGQFYYAINADMSYTSSRLVTAIFHILENMAFLQFPFIAEIF